MKRRIIAALTLASIVFSWIIVAIHACKLFPAGDYTTMIAIIILIANGFIPAFLLFNVVVDDFANFG